MRIGRNNYDLVIIYREFLASVSMTLSGFKLNYANF